MKPGQSASTRTPRGLFSSASDSGSGETGRASAYDDGDPASAMTFGIRSPGRTASPPFLMQFPRRFADVSLGQRGVMYVSGRSAYYQSRAL